MFNPKLWYTQKSDHPGGLLIKPIPGQVVAQCDEGGDMEKNAELIAGAPLMLRLLRRYAKNNKDNTKATITLKAETSRFLKKFE